MYNPKHCIFNERKGKPKQVSAMPAHLSEVPESIRLAEEAEEERKAKARTVVRAPGKRGGRSGFCNGGPDPTNKVMDVMEQEAQLKREREERAEAKRLEREAQAAKAKQEEEERKRLEAEEIRCVEEEERKFEEERLRIEAEEARKRQEAEDAERQARQAAEEKKKQEMLEQARLKKTHEDEALRLAEEKKKKKEEEERLARERETLKRLEEERLRRIEEERRQEEERKREEEMQRQEAAEKERLRLLAEAKAARLKAEEEQRRLREEQQKAEEARRAEEAARLEAIRVAAATQVQALVRGRGGRKLAVEEQSRAEEEQRKKEALEDAFRKKREEFEKKKAEEAAILAQQEAATTKIAAMWRGKQGRQLASAKRIDEKLRRRASKNLSRPVSAKSSASNNAVQEVAATKVQSFYRGWKVRRAPLKRVNTSLDEFEYPALLEETVIGFRQGQDIPVAKAHPLLLAVSTVLRQQSHIKIYINGHKRRGEGAGLGMKRAEWVRDHLINLGVRRNQVRPLAIAEHPSAEGKCAVSFTIIQEIKLKNPITFEAGQVELDEHARVALEHVSRVLGEHLNLTLRIEGHTDSDETKLPYVQPAVEVAQSRALAVAQQLEHLGISKHRLRHVGLAADCPVTTNLTQQGRRQNRRIELHLVDSLTAGAEVAGRASNPGGDTHSSHREVPGGKGTIPGLAAGSMLGASGGMLSRPGRPAAGPVFGGSLGRSGARGVQAPPSTLRAAGHSAGKIRKGKAATKIKLRAA